MISLILVEKSTFNANLRNFIINKVTIINRFSTR